jgi:hypothetical protein
MSVDSRAAPWRRRWGSPNFGPILTEPLVKLYLIPLVAAGLLGIAAPASALSGARVLRLEPERSNIESVHARYYWHCHSFGEYISCHDRPRRQRPWYPRYRDRWPGSPYPPGVGPRFGPGDRYDSYPPPYRRGWQIQIAHHPLSDGIWDTPATCWADIVARADIAEFWAERDFYTGRIICEDLGNPPERALTELLVAVLRLGGRGDVF